jgi:cytochrome c-type biogenesis protein
MLELSGIGLIAAFLAGAVSFVSPCVLPLVPGYVSYVAGHTAGTMDIEPSDRRRQAISMGLYFVVGFSTIFMVLGASATALGQMLLSYRYELNFVGGAIVILFGLFMIGMAKITMMQREFRFRLSVPGGRPLSAYVLGLAFGFGWTPCIGPILGAILTASAASATVPEGVALLAIYSAGLGFPFLFAAAFTDRLTRRLRTIGQIGRRLHQVAGLVMVAMGIAMMTGQLSALSYWLLDAFSSPRSHRVAAAVKSRHLTPYYSTDFKVSDEMFIELDAGRDGVGSPETLGWGAEALLQAVAAQPGIAFERLAPNVMEQVPLRMTHLKRIVVDQRRAGLLRFDLAPGKRTPSAATKIWPSGSDHG